MVGTCGKRVRPFDPNSRKQPRKRNLHKPDAEKPPPNQTQLAPSSAVASPFSASPNRRAPVRPNPSNCAGGGRCGAELRDAAISRPAPQRRGRLPPARRRSRHTTPSRPRARSRGPSPARRPVPLPSGSRTLGLAPPSRGRVVAGASPPATGSPRGCFRQSRQLLKTGPRTCDETRRSYGGAGRFLRTIARGAVAGRARAEALAPRRAGGGGACLSMLWLALAMGHAMAAPCTGLQPQRVRGHRQPPRACGRGGRIVSAPTRGGARARTPCVHKRTRALMRTHACLRAFGADK